MRDFLLTFLQNPSRESFTALRSEVMAHPEFDPADTSLDGVAAMLADGMHDEAAELIRAQLVPDFLLSPGAHWSLGYALRMIGDERGETFEFSLGQQLLNGIQLSGEGTEESPWLVSRTSDQYDLLLSRDLKLKTQAIVRVGDRSLDRMETHSGEVFYFDITDILAIMAGRLGSVGLE